MDKEAISDEARPMEEVRASGTGTRTGRLYFTDGTIPNYAEVSKPLYTPGQIPGPCHASGLRAGMQIKDPAWR